VANVMGWDSVRIAQDDVVWKLPSNRAQKTQRLDTVGYHQDSAYISAQFDPYENNSVTVWMALDDADEENGCVEYAVGSHKWRPLLHVAGDIATEEGGASNDGSEISSFHSADESSYRKGISAAASLAGCDNPLELIETAPVKAGHAIFHHQDAWHGSGPNSSTDRHRRALVGHYIRGDVTFVQCRGSANGPFGNTSYIYGRYRRWNSVDVDESFFPIIHGRGGGSCLSRTEWVDDYLYQSFDEQV
jgi:ectoine hydroxylase-related dioxygenase (phytanoyl-CoA dioxygenase family)